MQKAPDEFQAALDELRETLSQVMEPLLNDERGVLLSELMEHQLKGVEKFYALLNSEVSERIFISSKEFDRIIDKYRPVMRYFAKFPKTNEKSTYNMSIISDVFYMLRHHAHEQVSKD